VKKVASPAERTDVELLEQFEAEARTAGFAAPGVKAIAKARLLALRENIPYDEASARLAAETKVEMTAETATAIDPVSADTRAASTETTGDTTEETKSDAPDEDPVELERHQMFKELVDGGTSEAEARALIWPEQVPEIERAVRTPPETAVAPAQRPPRRR
jgi:hypothetical protein